MRYTITLMLAGLLAVSAFSATQITDARAAEPYDGKVKACNGEEVHLKPAEKKTLALHNKERRDRDMRSLCIQQQLQKAADGHSEDMLKKEYFSHTSKDDTTFDERIKQAGYTSKDFEGYRVSENLAYGSGAKSYPKSIHQAWMDSDGHRKNMLDRRLRQAGISVASGNYKGNDGTNVYTVDFGARHR